MPLLDQTSLKLFDDLKPYDDLIEVDFMPLGCEERTVSGLFAGFERSHIGAWYLIVSGKATVRTIDIVSVRRIEEIIG